MPSPSEAVALPAGSLVSQLGFTSYADAYRVALDPDRVPDVDAFARMFVKNPPGWIRGLMGARDAVVGIFGLKKSSDAPASTVRERVALGDFLGMFRVTERTITRSSPAKTIATSISASRSSTSATRTGATARSAPSSATTTHSAARTSFPSRRCIA